MRLLFPYNSALADSASDVVSAVSSSALASWNSLSPTMKRNLKITATVVAALVVAGVVAYAMRSASDKAGSEDEHARDTALDGALDTVVAAVRPVRESSLEGSTPSKRETLTNLLDRGGSVVASDFDGKVSDLGSMSKHNAIRYGYMGHDEYWTDRGYDRATSRDYDQMHASNEAMAQQREAADGV